MAARNKTFEALVLGTAKRIEENTGRKASAVEVSRALGVAYSFVWRVLRGDRMRAYDAEKNLRRELEVSQRDAIRLRRKWCEGGHVVPVSGFGEPGNCRCGRCDECRLDRLCANCRAGEPVTETRALAWRYDHEVERPSSRRELVYANVRGRDQRFVAPIFGVR